MTNFPGPIEPRRIGPVTIYDQLVQGSDEWLQARCGMLTASEMCLILTPTIKVANNDKTRAHVWELLSQRITQHIEPHYISDDMLRGQEDEILARAIYHEKVSPVQEVGFITRDFGGFTIGYSPDGLVGDAGLIEIKSRRQKFQVETLATREIPAEYMLQIQTGILVTGRCWLDFISYSGGLPMCVLRAHRDDKVQAAILEAAEIFEEQVTKRRMEYDVTLASDGRLFPTERRAELEIML